MIKNKEQLIKVNSQRITQKVTDYINEMDVLSDTEQFTIDNIEQIWAQLNSDTENIYSEVNAELIRQINEKELIRKKKRNTQPKESSLNEWQIYRFYPSIKKNKTYKNNLHPIFDVKLTSGANSVMIAVETNEYPLLDVR